MKTITNMAEIKRLIEQLEGDAYFSMVQSVATSEGVTLRDAFIQVESLRRDIGLPHRYTSIDSFYSNRSRFHKMGGSIERFDTETLSENE